LRKNDINVHIYITNVRDPQLLGNRPITPYRGFTPKPSVRQVQKLFKLKCVLLVLET